MSEKNFQQSINFFLFFFLQQSIGKICLFFSMTYWCFSEIHWWNLQFYFCILFLFHSWLMMLPMLNFLKGQTDKIRDFFSATTWQNPQFFFKTQVSHKITIFIKERSTNFTIYFSDCLTKSDFSPRMIEEFSDFSPRLIEKVHDCMICFFVSIDLHNLQFIFTARNCQNIQFFYQRTINTFCDIFQWQTDKIRDFLLRLIGEIHNFSSRLTEGICALLPWDDWMTKSKIFLQWVTAEICYFLSMNDRQISRFISINDWREIFKYLDR